MTELACIRGQLSMNACKEEKESLRSGLGHWTHQGTLLLKLKVSRQLYDEVVLSPCVEWRTCPYHLEPCHAKLAWLES